MNEYREFEEINREHIGDLKYLGEFLGFCRVEKGLSQRQVALYANISNTELHRIEKGERQKPSPKILKQLSEILDVQYDVLLQFAGYLDLQDDISSNTKLNYELLSNEEKDYILDYLCKKWNKEAPKSYKDKFTKQDIENMLFDKTSSNTEPLPKTDVRDTGEQIDDVLNEAMIGMSKEEYNTLTETQKKQIRDFALFVKNQNEKENK